jgi:hypothetical protein
MFIATCLIILLLSLCTLFISLVIWLAHSLEGYPAFLIARANRDTVQLPQHLFVPNGPARLDALANSRSSYARRQQWTASTPVHHTTRRNKTAAI